jgi:hypothetical protein
MKSSKILQAPVNRIMRNPNFPSGYGVPNYERADPLLNSVKVLEDPENDRKLILIGTLNCSTVLAERTRTIIERFNPDSILVETTPNWYDEIKANLGGRLPRTNEDVYNAYFRPLANLYIIENNPRTLTFKSKMYPWLMIMGMLFKAGMTNCSAFRPGLEVFNAIKYAKENHKEVLYSGQVFNSSALKFMAMEPRMYLIPLLYRIFTAKNNMFWEKEWESYFGQLNVHGMPNFSEWFDDTTINWFIKFFERIAPYQKRILIDQEDDRLFHLIYQDLDGKNLVAIVNHWHLPGIEYHWRHTTGTEIKQEFINPIGDFDINQYIEGKMVNEQLRKIKSKVAKTEPAVTSDYLTPYIKQQLETERERHVFFDSYVDPDLEHGLFNDENKSVANLPYDPKGHH